MDVLWPFSVRGAKARPSLHLLWLIRGRDKRKVKGNWNLPSQLFSPVGVWRREGRGTVFCLMAQGDKEKQFRSSASISTKLKLGVVIFNPRWEYLMNQNPQISTEKKVILEGEALLDPLACLSIVSLTLETLPRYCLQVIYKLSIIWVGGNYYLSLNGMSRIGTNLW